MTTCALYQGRDLPPLIQRAITRANDPNILKDLTPTYRWALSVLLRRVSAADGKDIFWVKRENFAKLLDASEATVYRILSTLEKHGLIERVHQKRDDDGTFAVGELRLSDHLCHLLGLTPEDKKDPQTLYKNPSFFSRSANLQDGHIEVNQEEQFSSKRQSHRKSLQPCRTKKPSTKCPEDLETLRTQGLTLPQVFLLMKLARQHEKRLSDIVFVTHDAIRHLRERSLFAYLRSLLTQDKDFAWIKQQNTLQQEKIEAALELKTEQTRLKDECRESWFASKTGFYFEVSSQAAVTVYNSDMDGLNCLGGLAGAEERNFWQKVKEGCLQKMGKPSMALC